MTSAAPEFDNGDTGDRHKAANPTGRRPNPLDVYVGSRVRLRRTLIGMTQEKLGERLGLTFQQVQKYEKGANRIGASRLYELATILGVTVMYFYEGAPVDGVPGMAEPTSGYGEGSLESDISEFVSSREGIEFLRSIVRIKGAKQRRTLIELMRSMADGDASD